MKRGCAPYPFASIKMLAAPERLDLPTGRLGFHRDASLSQAAALAPPAGH